MFAAKCDDNDHLSLGSSLQLQNILSKYGGDEKVIFSDFVSKINRKGKTQQRTLLITGTGLYNLKPKGKTYQIQRRINIDDIVAITTSQQSDEFVIHVPEEYDYRYRTAKRDEIIDVLKKIRTKTKPLNVAARKSATLEQVCLTKTDMKRQTREMVLRRTQELAAKPTKSDDEDRSEVAKVEGIQEHEMMGELGATDAAKQKVGIGDFELMKVLGRGAFGKVMQVRKKDDGQVYAMKILKKAAILARNQVEHTKAERKILQALQHPFLMTLRFAFQSKEKLYLVLDYFQGGELFYHLKTKRRFREDVARLYVAEIAMAFGHLHSKDVIYRDLKPENILLDDGGHVCLTDFGLAKEMPQDTKTDTFCGTPEYLAPEIIQGSGHDKAVDWWSLGILLYELTVGIPPFYSPNVNDMYNKIQHGNLRFPPFLSDPCKALIIALLAREPAERLGSKDDFNDLKPHPFFAELDWDEVYAKKVDAPFKPKVKGIEDTSNFDEEFLNEPVVDSVVQQSQFGNNAEHAFNQFTFEGKDHAL